MLMFHHPTIKSRTIILLNRTKVSVQKHEYHNLKYDHFEEIPIQDQCRGNILIIKSFYYSNNKLYITLN